MMTLILPMAGLSSLCSSFQGDLEKNLEIVRQSSAMYALVLNTMSLPEVYVAPEIAPAIERLFGSIEEYAELYL